MSFHKLFIKIFEVCNTALCHSMLDIWTHVSFIMANYCQIITFKQRFPEINSISLWMSFINDVQLLIDVICEGPKV